MNAQKAVAARAKSALDCARLLRHNVRLDRIEYRLISDLKSYGRKLRKRSALASTALQTSVASFGIILPIPIDGNGTIIGGEGIVEAAGALGYDEIPTVRIEHLGDAEVRLLRIALNKLGEKSDWDSVELGQEFVELLELDVDLQYEVTGFDTIEIDNLVHSPHVLDEEDPADEVITPGLPGDEVTRLGDMWALGVHRALCDSSLEMASLALLMGDDRARMVLNDGPYNVPIAGHVSGLGKNQHREFAQASGEMSEAQFIDFQCKSTAAVAAFCEDGALLYLFMDWRHQWEMLSGIRAAGLKQFNLAVWVKRSGSMGSFLRSQHELVFIAKKGSAPHRNNVQLGLFGRNRTNCWFYPGVNSFGAGRDEQLASHPTPKNVAMLEDAIRDATHRGEIVLDAFLGSGTTLIAAERTGRICRGIELDPLYVDSVIHRWEKATGRLVTLHATGETFAEVEQRRKDEREAEPLIKILVNPRPRTRVDA